MKPYYNAISPNCHKVMLALNEKGIACDLVPTNLFDPQVREAYTRDVNPFGRVPMLILDDGGRVPESSIIVGYLDTHFGGTRLIPEGRDLARRARFFDRVADLYVIEQFGATTRPSPAPATR